MRTGQEFIYGELGIVHLTVRSNSRNCSARWRDGKVYLVVPPWATAETVRRALDDMSPRLLAVKPATDTYVGDTVRQYDDFVVRLVQTYEGDTAVVSRIDSGVPRVYSIHADYGSLSDSRTVLIGKHLRHIGRHVVMTCVIPRGMEIAAMLGLTVRGWDVGHGRNTMGTCSSHGHIRLSQALAFKSLAERDSVICHELAHLTHFDHSAAFHALHRRYCDTLRHMSVARRAQN